MTKPTKRQQAEDSGRKLAKSLDFLMNRPDVPAASEPATREITVEPALRVLEAMRVAREDARAQGRLDLDAELDDLEGRLTSWCEEHGFTLAQAQGECDITEGDDTAPQP